MQRYVIACTHLFPDTHRCGSPALRGAFQLPALTSKRAAQQALAEVIRRLAANKLDVHRAGLLLYSLQIAGNSLQ